MNDQIDPYARGHNSTVFNDQAANLELIDRLNNADERAKHLPQEFQMEYNQMRKSHDKQWHDQLDRQQADHQPGYDKAFRDYLTSMRGFDLEYTSPSKREAQADKHAARHMAQKEANEQNLMLKGFVRLREGFVDQMEAKIARSATLQNTDGNKR